MCQIDGSDETNCGSIGGKGFLDQENRKIPADGIENTPVFANQRRFERFGNSLPGAILELAGAGFGIDLREQVRRREGETLMRFRTAQDFEQFGADHDWLAFNAAS